MWQDRLTAGLPNVKLTLLVGMYAQKKFLGKSAKRTLTETVRTWQDYGPEVIPLPHPSWRNNSWIKRNPWFDDVLKDLRQSVQSHL